MHPGISAARGVFHVPSYDVPFGTILKEFPDSIHHHLIVSLEIPSLKQDERLPIRMRTVLTEAGIGAGLVAPLLWKGEVVGSIAAGRYSEDSFSTQDAQFLATAASQVAVILNTAVFVEEVRHSSANDAAA